MAWLGVSVLIQTLASPWDAGPLGFLWPHTFQPKGQIMSRGYKSHVRCSVQGPHLVRIRVQGQQFTVYRVMAHKGELSLGLLQPVYTQKVSSCSQFQWLFKSQIWWHVQPPLNFPIDLKIKSNSSFHVLQSSECFVFCLTSLSYLSPLVLLALYFMLCWTELILYSWMCLAK